MTKDYGTIRIPREEFDRHNERRKDLGLTWLQYLDGQAPELADVEVDEAALADAVAERLDGAGTDANADALATVEERTGRIERLLEDMGAGR